MSPPGETGRKKFPQRKGTKERQAGAWTAWRRQDVLGNHRVTGTQHTGRKGLCRGRRQQRDPGWKHGVVRGQQEPHPPPHTRRERWGCGREAAGRVHSRLTFQSPTTRPGGRQKTRISLSPPTALDSVSWLSWYLVIKECHRGLGTSCKESREEHERWLARAADALQCI